MKFGLEQRIINIFIEVFEANSNVDKAFMFGSRAKGNYRPDSDIDIAIKGQNLSTDDIIAMSVAIETKGIMHKFDLIDYNSIKEHALKEHIDRVGIELYSRLKTHKLKEFANIQTGPFGSQLHSFDYVNYGIPSIMPTNIGNRLNIITDKIVYVGDKDIERLKKYTVKEEDIVYSRRGDVEKCAFITKDQSGWLCGTGCLRIRFTSEAIVPKFCAYYLSTPDIKNWVLNSAVGTTMSNLNTSILGEVPLILPSIREQKTIADALTSLDNKIDFLHRQNETLEQLAQTIFRKWFIIDAKEDWQEKSILDFPNLSLLKPGIKHFEGEKIYLATADVQGKEIVNNEIKITFVNRPSRANMQPIINSIWFAKMNESPKYLLIDSFSKNYAEKYILSTGFYGIHTKTGIYFIWNFFNTDDFENQKTANISGSVMEALNSEGLKGITLRLPPLYSILDYENKVTPYYQKISCNNSQILTLTQLRNTVLPKLMSGEVRMTL